MPPSPINDLTLKVTEQMGRLTPLQTTSDNGSDNTEPVDELWLIPGHRCLPPMPVTVKQDKDRELYTLLLLGDSTLNGAAAEA